MKKFSLDEWRAYLLAQAKEYRVEIKEKRPAVTISRETGAGAITIGQMVTDSFQSLEKGRLHSWALFDQNIVKAVLEEQGLPERLEEFIKEEGKPALEDAFEELLGLHPSTPTLARSMSRTIRKLAAAGGVVLIGRGAHVICANLSHALHVRLVAPLETRVQHIADYFKLSEKEAAKYVEKTDRSRKEYVRRYFGVDVADPHEYHLVINAGKVGYQEAAKIIVGAACASARSDRQLGDRSAIVPTETPGQAASGNQIPAYAATARPASGEIEACRGIRPRNSLPTAIHRPDSLIRDDISWELSRVGYKRALHLHCSADCRQPRCGHGMSRAVGPSVRRCRDKISVLLLGFQTRRLAHRLGL